MPSVVALLKRLTPAFLSFKHQVPLMSAVADPSTPLAHDAVAIVGAGEIAKVGVLSLMASAFLQHAFHLCHKHNIMDF